MNIKIACGVVLGMLTAGLASAQTTCPAGPTSGTILTTDIPKIVWCQPPPTPANVIGANVYGLPVTKIPVTGLVVLGGPFSGDGNIQYQGTIPSQPAGVYSITIRAVNLAKPGDPTSAQESPASTTPFALTVSAPVAVAAAPVKVQVLP